MVDCALQRTLKPQLCQIGKSCFCVQLCGKKRRQHSVVLLMNDRSKPLVCYVSRRFCSLIRTPALYGPFRLSRQKAHMFSLKLTRFIRTPVNTDNGHFSVSRVTNSHILSTPLYGHWLSAHCLFSLSQLCDNCRHCTLFK